MNRDILEELLRSGLSPEDIANRMLAVDATIDHAGVLSALQQIQSEMQGEYGGDGIDAPQMRRGAANYEGFYGDWRYSPNIPVDRQDEYPYMGFVKPQDKQEYAYNQAFDEVFAGDRVDMVYMRNVQPGQSWDQAFRAAHERWNSVRQQWIDGQAGRMSASDFRGAAGAGAFTNPYFLSKNLKNDVAAGVFRRADGMYQINRAGTGQFGSLVSVEKLQQNLKNRFQQALRDMVLANYDTKDIGKGQGEQSGKLKESIRNLTVDVAPREDGGFDIGGKLADMKREARGNESGDSWYLSTQVYGALVFRGRLPVFPKRQRYLRFKINGHIITARNVKASEPKNAADLNDEQVRALSRIYGEAIAEAFQPPKTAGGA